MSATFGGLNLPVFRPILPPAELLQPYLRQIDAHRWYSNDGPLVKEFEREVGNLLSTDSVRVVASSSGTSALVQALSASASHFQHGLCLLPSWTFPATAAAVIAAGLEPYFLDVEYGSGALSPSGAEQVVQRLVRRGDAVRACLPVMPFGAPIDLVKWNEFSASTGVPVVIDAAAGFGTLASLGPTSLAELNSLTMAISLHATKVLGVGEGGLVVAPTELQASVIRSWGNFGFESDRVAVRPGLNAKMSEYSAAVGLAQIQLWEQTSLQWLHLASAFRDLADRCSRVRAVVAPHDGAISSFGIVECHSEEEVRLIAAFLHQNGVMTRRWWESGCHNMPAYSHFGREPLVNTEQLARHTLGLPFYADLSLDDMALVFELADAAS